MQSNIVLKPDHSLVTHSSQPEWNYLPDLVLCLILDKLWEPLYHALFALVCKQWHLVAKDYNKTKQQLHKVIPMLMISINKKNKTKKALYGVTEGKVFKNILEVFYAKRCCGSSNGWLATVDKDMVITLLNPFFKTVPKITLPRLFGVEYIKGYAQFFVLKVILSADPISSPDYVVATVFSLRSQLAFIKPNQDSCWTYIDKQCICFTDIIFYKSLLYAVERWGWVVSFDVHNKQDSSQQLEPNTIVPRSFDIPYPTYLVESSKGDLLVVRRFLKMTQGKTKNFKVYKLLLNDQIKNSIEEHVELESLGDEALFVGDNHSMSVLASNFPGCRPNSIYFTDFCIDNPFLPEGPFDDVGIFCLENRTFGKHYTPKGTHKYLAPPIWVVPPRGYILLGEQNL